MCNWNQGREERERNRRYILRGNGQEVSKVNEKQTIESKKWNL